MQIFLFDTVGKALYKSTYLERIFLFSHLKILVFKKLSVQVHIGPAEILPKNLRQIAPENLDSAKLISLATFLDSNFL